MSVATGKTIEETAAEAGVTARSVYRWLRLPGFQRRISAIRGQVVRSAAGRLADTMNAAVDALRGLLDDDDPSVRRQAASEILRASVKLIEVAELETRIAALEARQAEGQPVWR